MIDKTAPIAAWPSSAGSSPFSLREDVRTRSPEGRMPRAAAHAGPCAAMETLVGPGHHLVFYPSDGTVTAVPPSDTAASRSEQQW